MSRRGPGIAALLMLVGAGVFCVHAAEPASNAEGAPTPGRNGLIVFASNRAENLFPQVYGISASGGPRRNLSRMPTKAATAPVPSPDGLRITYEAGGLIYVSRLDGRERRKIGPGREASWAPDSQRLAFARDVQVGPELDDIAETIVVADLRTGVVRELFAPTPTRQARHPSWSPDGSRIAFTDGFVTIVSAVDGAVVRRLSTGGSPTWAPRGDRIAIAGDDTGRLTIIDDRGRTVSQLDADGAAPAWSPDGRLLAFTSLTRANDVVFNGRIEVVNADGGGRRTVARTIVPEEAFDFAWPFPPAPAWSRDGRSLAFASASQVYVVRRDGHRLRRVTREPRSTLVSDPGWTRSNRIVYASLLTSNDYDLYTMRADGSGVRRLTRSNASEVAPVWSPDGTTILYERRSKLFLLNTLSGRIRAVPVRGASHKGAPAWSPDGSRIVFANDRGIYTVASTGGAARRIYRSDLAYEPRWSPDGKLIAFGAAGALFVMRPDGSRVRELEWDPEDLGTSCFHLLDTLAWAPGGSLAFVHSYECRGENFPHEETIELVRLNGSHVGTFEAHSTGRLAWSPDGRWLLQAGGDRDSYYSTLDGDIARMRSDGTERIELTRGRSGIDPDWQPLCNLRGTARADRLAGTAADELLCGLRGADTVVGRAGSDRLFGEEGNDRFFARDGEFDVVGCGPGSDAVEADAVDLVGRDCERVERG